MERTGSVHEPPVLVTPHERCPVSLQHTLCCYLTVPREESPSQASLLAHTNEKTGVGNTYLADANTLARERVHSIKCIKVYVFLLATGQC